MRRPRDAVDILWLIAATTAALFVSASVVLFLVVTAPHVLTDYLWAAAAAFPPIAVWVAVLLYRPPYARGFCPECGYDVRLHGDAADRLRPRCPECGTAIPVREDD